MNVYLNKYNRKLKFKYILLFFELINVSSFVVRLFETIKNSMDTYNKVITK